MNRGRGVDHQWCNGILCPNLDSFTYMEMVSFLTVWRKPEPPSEENPQQAKFLELGSDRVEFKLTQQEILQPESAHLILLYNWRPTNQFQWVNNFCKKGTFNVLKFDTYDHRGLYTPLTFRTIKIYSSHYYWGFLH